MKLEWNWHQVLAKIFNNKIRLYFNFEIICIDCINPKNSVKSKESKIAIFGNQTGEVDKLVATALYFICNDQDSRPINQSKFFRLFKNRKF